MKAIVCTKSGPPDVLELKEVEKPVPRDNEVLVKIHASTVTIGDAIIRKIPRLILLPMGLLFGFKSKKITGHEFAGVVEATGKEVKLIPLPIVSLRHKPFAFNTLFLMSSCLSISRFMDQRVTCLD